MILWCKICTIISHILNNEWMKISSDFAQTLLQCGISAFGPKYQTNVCNKCIFEKVEWTEFTDLKTYVNIFKEFKIVYLFITEYTIR